MPSVLLTESIAVELGAREPWPQDVKLFQPYEVEQILLPDNANCLAVQAFLKMCGLDFEVTPRPNAEYMSPSGRVPFIKCGAFLIAELDPIVSFVNNKGISLTDKLEDVDKADMRAYMSLINNVLGNAELYLCWVDNTTYSEVTKPRYGCVHPWPLNHYLPYSKRRQVIKKLKILGWTQKSLDEVYQDIENCCNALSERLDNKEYFFGSRPTEIDALVFGHLFSILNTAVSPTISRMQEAVSQFKNLMEHTQNIQGKFFKCSLFYHILEPMEPLDMSPSNFEVSEQQTVKDMNSEEIGSCKVNESGVDSSSLGSVKVVGIDADAEAQNEDRTSETPVPNETRERESSEVYEEKGNAFVLEVQIAECNKNNVSDAVSEEKELEKSEEKILSPDDQKCKTETLSITHNEDKGILDDQKCKPEIPSVTYSEGTENITTNNSFIAELYDFVNTK